MKAKIETPAEKKKPAPKKGAGATARDLTPKQSLFALEYLVDLNATQAAIRAGYSAKTAASQGERLLRNVEIQAEIAKARKAREERTAVSSDRVLLEAARIALFDPRRLFNDDGTTKAITDLDDDTAAAVSGIKVRRISGEENENCSIIEYKVADKNSALEKLFRHHGLYERDNNQKTDPLTSLLHAIAGGNGSAFKPVADDPEREEQGED